MCREDECAKPGVVRIGDAGSSTAFDIADCLLAKFDFGGRFGGDSYPCVSPAQQSRFQDDFQAQVTNVLKRLHDYQWLADHAVLPPRVTTGPYQPRTDFHVFVSEMYGKSRSLVPAWSGQRGWMEFPAYRVAGGTASIAHELVHVLFPNGNRMLAEGLAVYLQGKLSKTPVYPNFGIPLNDMVAGFLSAYDAYDGEPVDRLWQLNLDSFEQISTPDELGLAVGKDMIGARPGHGLKDGDDEPSLEEGKDVYVVAGSLVEFLLENPIEDSLLTEMNFGALYNSTPLRPLERCPGNPVRWKDCYKGKGKSYSFKEIGLLWKTYLHVEFVSDGARIPGNLEHDHPLVGHLAKQLRGRGGKTQGRKRKAQGRKRK
jgi:hypothetical protein